jgi:hypothetical protein
MTSVLTPRLAAALVLAFAPAGVRGAQVRASERGTVSQVVDGTTITIDYSRPVARGRVPLFGRVVRWGDVWTPGANWATTLEVSNPVQLNGQPLARGKYSVWMIPREKEPWTVFLNDNARLFHTQKPDPASARLTLTVAPQPAPHMEVLTWSFPLVAREGATLQMQWGTNAIPLDVTVPDSHGSPRPALDAQPYIGFYRVKFEPQEPGGQEMELDMEIVAAEGRLRARFSPPVPDMDPYFDLVPAAPGTFKPQYLKGGKVFESDEETAVVFQLANGRATGFQFIFNGEAYARATRK